MQKCEYYGLTPGSRPSWKTRGNSSVSRVSVVRANARLRFSAPFSSERFARGNGRAEYGCRVHRQPRERYSDHHAPDGPARMVAMVLRVHGHDAAAGGHRFI